MGVELRVDAFNFLNHANYQGFNAFNITSLLGFGALNPAAPAGTGFFNCVSCMRPNGTLVGSNNQVLTVQNIQHGIFDTNLVKPIFGGIGDPSTTDIARTFQLSFHVRF